MPPLISSCCALNEAQLVVDAAKLEIMLLIARYGGSSWLSMTFCHMVLSICMWDAASAVSYSVCVKPCVLCAPVETPACSACEESSALTVAAAIRSATLRRRFRLFMLRRFICR